MTAAEPWGWPAGAEALVRLQEALAAASPAPWSPPGPVAVGASYVCFERGPHDPGDVDERGWAGAACKQPGRRAHTAVASARVAAPYAPGLLARREGRLRAAAVRLLKETPDILLVDATGRDHPRRAGLALHLGAVLGVPTIGVTDRPLAARATEPDDRRGAARPLVLDGEVVGYSLRTRAGVRPVFVSAGWRTDPQTCVEVVLAAASKARTPQPLREARRSARGARGRRSG